MVKINASLVLVAAGCLAMASAALGQAPSTAQVWDVRFVLDSSGPYVPGPSSTQVGITIFARVGILPNTSLTGTTNFGMSRVGGQLFRMTIQDAFAANTGSRQGVLALGHTGDVSGESLTDTNGQPLAGHFPAFRGSFAPQVGPNYLGVNSDPANGSVNNPAMGSPFVTNVVGSRALNYGAGGIGPQGAAIAPNADPLNLMGDLAPIYRIYYFPDAEGGEREISLSMTSMSGRYIHTVQGIFGTAAPARSLPDQSITFTVPSPGAGALAALMGLAGCRRRR